MHKFCACFKISWNLMANPKFWDISIIFGDFSMLSKLKFVSDYKPKWFARKILESFSNRVKKYHGLKVNDFFLQQKTRKMKISWNHTFLFWPYFGHLGMDICQELWRLAYKALTRSIFEIMCSFFAFVPIFRRQKASLEN